MFNNIFKKSVPEETTPSYTYPCFNPPLDLRPASNFLSIEHYERHVENIVEFKNSTIDHYKGIVDSLNKEREELRRKYQPYRVFLEIVTGTKFYVVYNLDGVMVEAFEDKAEALQFVEENTPKVAPKVEGK